MTDGNGSPSAGDPPPTQVGTRPPFEPGASGALVRTFVIADVRGYTRFTHEHGDEAAARLASAFATLARDVVTLHKGEVIELRGDEALCVFASAREALRAAVDLQTTFRRPADDGPAFPLPIGIGIDAGEAVPIEGGYRGGALNTAARLCSIAAPGQILATDTAVSLARRVDGIRFAGPRAVRLKGLRQPVRVVEVVPEAGLPPLPTVPVRTPAVQIRRLAVGAIVAILLASGLVALGISRSTRGEFLAGLDANTVGVIDAEAAALAAEVKVGGGPGAIAAGGGFVWVASETDGTVSRIDPATRAVQTLAVGESATGVAYGDGFVWVTKGEERAVAQVNPDPLRVVQTIPVGNGPGAVAAGDNAVWVANTIDGTVSRIDLARSSAKTTTIPVGSTPTAIAATGDAVWVASQGGNTVLRLDPRSGGVVEAVNVGNDPAAIAIGEQSIWVANREDGTVSRIDPATNSVTDTIPVGANPDAIAAGLGSVWVANSGDGTVSQIEPAAGRVEKTIPLESSPSGLTLAAGSVWASTLPSPRSHRDGVLQVEYPLFFPPFLADVCRCIDPVAPVPWAISTLLHDGLLTYRRAEGIAGSALVGNLAVRVPKPTDEGRTYTFQLRRDIRFSNGAHVRASDVRSSIERTRASPLRFNAYAGIQGIDDIDVDDEAGRITFHLSKPRPDFLHELAIPLASVVPSGTPLDPATDQPIPGTGPYRVASFDPDRRLRLVRNQYFRAWSPDARPDGYPDEISFHLSGDVEGRVAAVERGRADWVALSTDVSSDRLSRLLTTHAGRLHSSPGAGNRWMFVNTEVPPFNDPRVRQALNYGTDRGKVAVLLGGTLFARPSCQILPPGFAGYRPYCPYTVSPNPAGTWTAPDLGKAKALIAASGTRGMQVDVSATFESESKLERYFSSLLRQLGYRSSRTIAYSPDRAQIGLFGWYPVPATPSRFFVAFACSGITLGSRGLNASRFCDSAIDRRAQEAALAQASDSVRANALWADLDQALVDRAPVVPLAPVREVALVSDRVGNYRRHAWLGPLFEQMWVK